MPPDDTYLLYCIANTFYTTLGIEVCPDTKAYMKSKLKEFSKLDTKEKIYYTKYSVHITGCLMEYLEEVSKFELNVDPEADIIHDFRVSWKKDNVIFVSLDHSSINIRNIIPDKLMKVCKYKKNTKICRTYNDSYQKWNSKTYQRIQSKERYSQLTEKNKNKNVLIPLCQLVIDTLSKKRKCALNLSQYLFEETDRIVFKLYKNRFTMYDFGTELEPAESFRMKLNLPNEIVITFSNKAKFVLSLQTNATEIKEHLSVKFHTIFRNIDDIFMVKSVSVLSS